MFDPNLEVPDLRLCKKLKELGYPQDGGGWYWNIWGDSNGKPFLMFIEDFENFSFVYEAPKAKKEDYFIKAPTCRELWKYIEPYRTIIYISIDPDRLANDLIWLVKNEYVKFEEGRQR